MRRLGQALDDEAINSKMALFFARVAMGDLKHYAIREGVEGRERLRLLSRIMHWSSTSLFDRLHLADGLMCLDAGCGGGDVTRELARRVAPNGRVVGTDIDDTKIQLASQHLNLSYPT